MKITMPPKRTFKMWKREQQAKKRTEGDKLTPGQETRLKALVSSLTTPKPPAKPTLIAKAKPAAATRKPTGGRVPVGKDLDNVIGQDIVEFAAMLKRGRFAPGGAMRSLVR